MDKLKYRKTILDDIDHLVENMRQEDVDEMIASGSVPIDETLHRALRRSSKIITAIDFETDKPVFIGGIKPYTLLSKTGAPWMLGTTENYKYRRNLLKDVREFLKEYLETYEEIYNYVHVKNEISIRWLKALGFEFGEPAKFHRTGEYFMRFSMKRGDHNV